MCIRKVIGMDDRIIMLVCIPIMGFCIPLLFFNATLADGLLAYLPKAIIAFFYTLAYWGAIRFLIIFFRRKFPSYPQMAKRLGYTFLAIVPVYTVINQTMGYVHREVGVGAEIEGVTELDYNVVSILLILLIATLYESVWLYTRWKESIVAQETLRREYVQSQLEGLRSQVNPHFLFNSLNTLTYLIPEDSDRAVKFVQKMSKVYRYILEIKDQQLVSLEEELKFLEAYIFLLKERFGDNLNIEVEVPKAYYGLHLIPLSLQMLMENVIKHNVISVDKPLAVKLWVENDQLMVRNNLQRKAQAMPSTKVGLENIKHRYSFYTDQAMEVMETSDHFVVGLPLLKSAVLA